MDADKIVFLLMRNVSTLKNIVIVGDRGCFCLKQPRCVVEGISSVSLSHCWFQLLQTLGLSSVCSNCYKLKQTHWQIIYTWNLIAVKSRCFITAIILQIGGADFNLRPACVVSHAPPSVDLCCDYVCVHLHEQLCLCEQDPVAVNGRRQRTQEAESRSRR